jgi:PAS domain S-box-containing protein
VKNNHKFIALVASVILLVAIMALASLQIFRQVESIAQARKNSVEFLTRTDALLGDIVDAESAQRAFIVTADEVFLKPYLGARDHIRGNLQHLLPLASAPDIRKMLTTLVPLVDAKLAHMAQTTETRRTRLASVALTELGFGEGKRLMDAIRGEMRSVIQKEKELLAQHDVELQSNMRHLYALIVAASLFTLLLALFFAYLIYRESQQQAKNIVHTETQRLLGVQEDINKQLLSTNLNLHISEERLAVTLDSIDDAVIATDAEGRVTLLNPLAERLTGWKRTESIGRPVEDIFHIINAETRQRHPIPVRETLAHGTTLGLANHTIVIARDDCSECDIADSCAPIRSRDGRVVGAVLVFRDVTERKRLDNALHKKNAELERARAIADKANLAKSDFLSSMSHELRTPLSAILGFAQLIDSGAPGPTPGQKRSLDQILKAGWYLLDLINEILDLALIESGKLSLSMEPVSLTSVMLECAAMIEPQAQKREISVTFPRFDAPCFVKADRTRLKQVLINLLTNAIKYNATGGTVIVDCIETRAQRLRISVKDAGAGLTPQQLAQLFQPFNRLGQEANAEEGTGIGLVMAKRLVELMGGVIGVESTVGQGSLFWIELNLTITPQVTASITHLIAALAPQEQEDAPLRTLLYVEDNAANLMLVEDIVDRRPDIKLLSASDGQSGIRMALATLPDVILMDINLPGMSGTQAMHILANDAATAHIPVVALSANAMPLDIENGLEAGFFRYLTKPIKVDEFNSTLDVALAFAKDHENTVAKFGPRQQ